MSKEDIRIAIIGAGRVAQHYKKILSSYGVNGFKIVGVCDIVQDAAENLANYWKCLSFDNLKVMIESTHPDLVIILTPSGLHYEHALLALESSCNVLVEKPITLVPDHARELMKIAQEKNLMLCVAFQNRLNPAIQCLKKARDNGRFGQITTATIRLRWCRYQDYYEDGWHGTWAQDGGVINQQAIHHVDALNWLMGPIKEVCATMGNRLNRLEAEDTLVGLLKFENGAFGTIEATTAARPTDIEASISVVGEGGLAVIGDIALNKITAWEFVEPLPEDEDVPNLYSNDVPNGYGLSHGPLLQETVDRLKEGSMIAPITVEDCISTCELIHALYCSYENGCWVKLDEYPISGKLGKGLKNL